MKPDQYGSRYWCVKTPNEIIHLYADRVYIKDGCLTLASFQKTQGGVDIPLEEQEPFVVYAFAPGQWNTIDAASCLDGGSVAVEHWNPREKEQQS